MSPIFIFGERLEGYEVPVLNERAVRAASSSAADSGQAAPDAAEAARCVVPEFAKAMGHEAMWKLHNNCQ
ncbi:MAG: hypothetical protein Q7J47_05155 [Azoarcus sp.]|nr:hypothetical protein [Azoarcus sp.]